MSEIKISVIVPTFNSSNTIERLMHSLSNQIFKDFEIIFIDDCSSDDTVDTIRKALENTNIKYQLLINESNRGPGYSRNRGIEKANGDYIVFIDSDDVVREDHLSSLYDNIKDYDSDISGRTIKSYKSDFIRALDSISFVGDETLSLALEGTGYECEKDALLNTKDRDIIDFIPYIKNSLMTYLIALPNNVKNKK